MTKIETHRATNPANQSEDNSGSVLAASPRTLRTVFDIGLHNGNDSAYYLQCGYRVVGVEANPVLAEHCKTRFADAIAAGMMHIVNAGILDRGGTFEFYRNLTDSCWSSFDRDRGQRGGRWEAVTVPCRTLADLISEYGKPFFIKVDVEGADLSVISTLNRESAPPYISCELNASDDIIGALTSLGYEDFKFVNGETFTSATPIFDHELGWRFLRKLTVAVPLIRGAVMAMPYTWRSKLDFDDKPFHRTGPVTFGGDSSGPFGEDAFGTWMNADAAHRWFDALVQNYRRDRREDTLWWDVHARRGSDLLRIP